MAEEYLSLSDIARELGISTAALATSRLPEPDVIVGTTGKATRGWSRATVDAWIPTRGQRRPRADSTEG